MSQRTRYLRNSAAVVALVAIILPAPLQAMLSANCRCDCCAEPEAVCGDARYWCDRGATAGAGQPQADPSVDCTAAGPCACCAATAQDADAGQADEGLGCRRCPCDPKRRTNAALWARLVNLRKKGKPKASLFAPDCPRRAPARIAQHRTSSDGLRSFMPATERCTVLCRFVF